MNSYSHTSPAPQLGGVDIFKFVMAFAVVFIHSESVLNTFRPGSGEYIFAVTWFINLAVSYFFVVSGFLMERKLSSAGSVDEKRMILKRSSRKAFRMFLLWMLVYLPVSVYDYAAHGVSFKDAFVRYVYSAVMFGESVYAWPLWYVYSMAIAFFIFSKALYRRHSIVFLALILAAAEGIYGILTHYNLPDGCAAVELGRKFGFRTLGGGLYLLAGMYAYCYRHLVADVRCIALLLGVSVALSYFSLPYNALFGGVGLLGIALRLDPGESSLCMSLRKISMWIYFIHMLVLLGLMTVLVRLDAAPGLYTFAVGGCLLSLLLSVLIYRLSRRRIRRLNYMVG